MAADKLKCHSTFQALENAQVFTKQFDSGVALK